MRIPFSSYFSIFSSVHTHQFILAWFVLGGILSGSLLFAAGSFQEDCLGKSPAGIALQSHLVAAKSGKVDSMFCAGAIHLYVQHDINKALPWLEKAARTIVSRVAA